MQTQGTSFRCMAMVAMLTTGFRIQKKDFPGESRSQSPQSSKFEIHRAACVLSMLLT